MVAYSLLSNGCMNKETCNNSKYIIKYKTVVSLICGIAIGWLLRERKHNKYCKHPTLPVDM